MCAGSLDLCCGVREVGRCGTCRIVGLPRAGVLRGDMFRALGVGSDGMSRMVGGVQDMQRVCVSWDAMHGSLVLLAA